MFIYLQAYKDSPSIPEKACHLNNISSVEVVCKLKALETDEELLLMMRFPNIK